MTSLTTYQISDAAKQVLGHDNFSIANPKTDPALIEQGALPGQTVSEAVMADILALAETMPTTPPPPPVTKIHAAWIKAYLSEQGWREELETIITNSGPIAQALWESGTTFNVSDKLVNDLWALHSQSANHSVQDVFDAANALRKSQTET